MANRIGPNDRPSAKVTEEERQKMKALDDKLKERLGKPNGTKTGKHSDELFTETPFEVLPAKAKDLAAGILGNDRFDCEHDLILDVCPVPPKPGPEMFFLRLKGNEMHTFTIYAKAIFGINVHFVGRRSSPHYRNEKKCPGCRAKNAKRWKGFLHCFDHNLSQEVFLELTPKSADSLLSQLGKFAGIRGNRIQVKRTGADNGRLTISVLTACPNPDAMPDAKDPLESLLKFWGIDNLDPDGVADAGNHSHDFE